MCILRFSRARRIALGLGLLGAFTLVGCDSGGGGVSESNIPEAKDGAHGKSQSDARKNAYGPTGNPVTTKAGVAPPAKGPAEKAP